MENQVSEPNNGTKRSKRSRALKEAGIIVPTEPIFARDKPAYDKLALKAAPTVRRIKECE